MPGCPNACALGVLAVLGIFLLLSAPFLRTSEIEALESCICCLFNGRLPGASQSSADGILSVVVPPIVTCFLGGPAGYRAAVVLNCPESEASHASPLLVPIFIGSSFIELPKSFCIIKPRSANVPSSSSLSESAPKQKTLSLPPIPMAGERIWSW